MLGAAAVVMSCTSGTGLVACGQTSPSDDGGTADAAEDQGFVAAYGGPLLDAAKAIETGAPDAPVAAYGGPIFDAGSGD